MNNFGARIRLFAKERFKTLTNLSNNLGLDSSYLQRIMKGKIKPGMDFFAKMRELGCDLNWLLEDIQNKPNYVAENKTEYTATPCKKYEEKIKELEAKLKIIEILTKNG